MEGRNDIARGLINRGRRVKWLGDALVMLSPVALVAFAGGVTVGIVTLAGVLFAGVLFASAGNIMQGLGILAGDQ